MNINSPLISKCVNLGFISSEKVTSTMLKKSMFVSLFLTIVNYLQQSLARYCGIWFHLPVLDLNNLDLSVIPIDCVSEALVKNIIYSVIKTQ